MRRGTLLLVVLLGCGDQAGVDPYGPLPSCANGEGLGTSSDGMLVCKPVPVSVSLPECGQTEGLTSTGDRLDCTSLLTGDSAGVQSRASALQTAVVTQNSRLNAFTALGVGPGLFLGLTAVTSVGRIQKAGADTGLNAANGICNDQYVGAHLCSIYDLYNTVVQGKLGAAQTIAPAWIYFPAWAGPFRAGEASPNEGLDDTCSDYTYPTSDHGYRGVVMEWTALPSAATGFLFHGGSDAFCHFPHPLACCR